MALEKYDFTVRHRPLKIQTHVDGLSRLPVGTAPPEDTLLHLPPESQEEAQPTGTGAAHSRTSSHG